MKTKTFTQKHVFKTFSLFGLFMILILCSNSIQAQTERTIKGSVNDETGPLDGATVLLKDTNIYTVTDETGAFTFPQRLKENDQLIISSLGYNDKVLTIDTNTSLINIIMDDYEIIIVGSLMIGNNDTKAANNN